MIVTKCTGGEEERKKSQCTRVTCEKWQFITFFSVGKDENETFVSFDDDGLSTCLTIHNL